MASIQLAGLASGFDWQSFIDQIVAAESIPITNLKAEQALNTRKSNALTQLGKNITDLQTAANALKADGLFASRTVKSTTAESNWALAAKSATPAGQYQFNVTQLATATRLNGATGISRPLSATNDVSGLTLASMTTALPITAGTFSVNGAKVTIATTDSLQDVFDRINTATSGNVTASYDSTTDRISLSSASEIVLGASNDTSNFLNATRLGNNGTGSISSSSTLGTVGMNTPLASARLRNPLTAVDGSGAGEFTINGVAVAYNVNTDSLSSVIAKINASNAGVTASYDANSDRIAFTNTSTGDVGLGLSEPSGGFLDAMGLQSGSSLVRGKNALFTVNGGSVVSSKSNTFDSSAHGIEGLSVTAATESSQTISVSANTDTMKGAINTFIEKFNAVQNYIDDQTKIVVGKDSKVTASLLASNREIQAWSSQMRSMAFSAVSGMSGTIQRLNDLGIDFSSQTATLSITDSSKLDNALRDKSTDIAAFFSTASTGFSARFDSFAKSIMGLTGTGTGGQMATQTDTLNKQNKTIDLQIATIQRHIEAEKSRLTASFTAMERAQATIKQMQSQLTSAFAAPASS